MLRAIISRFRRQDGIALPTVMGSLLLTTTLATTTLVVSLDSNQTTVKDRDAKRAGAAAEAAAERAFLIATQRGPAPGECVIEDPTKADQTPAPVGGECPVTTTGPDFVGAAGGGLGNGASLRWTVGPEGAAGCRELPNDPRPAGDPTRAQDRCITASATVNGVTRRVQTRILYQPPVTPWKQAGLVGKDLVDVDNGSDINSPIGTNGDVNIGQTKVSGDVYIPPGPDHEIETKTHGDYGNRIDYEWTFPPIDWATPREDHPNAEQRLLAAIATGGYGGVNYNATTRILNLPDGASLTLPGGLYHLCGVTAGNNSTIIVPSDHKVSLWIDSPRGNSTNPEVPSAGCEDGPNAGRLNFDKNGLKINADGTKNPAELQVFVYGTTSNFNGTGDPDVVIKNGAEFFGTIWAPDSTVDFKNNGEVAGGITGKVLDMKNNGGFKHDSRIFDMPLPGTGVAKRRGWFECSAEQVPDADPEARCQ